MRLVPLRLGFVWGMAFIGVLLVELPVVLGQAKIRLLGFVDLLPDSIAGRDGIDCLPLYGDLTERGNELAGIILSSIQLILENVHDCKRTYVRLKFHCELTDCLLFLVSVQIEAALTYCIDCVVVF
jgi:hypothetical protein